MHKKDIAFFTDPSIVYLCQDSLSIEDIENQKDIDDIYYLLHKPSIGIELKGNDDHYVYGQGLTRPFIHYLKDLHTLFTRISNRVYKLTRTLVEKVSKQYKIILTLWEDRIQKNIDRIVDDKFNNTTVKCISKDELKKRIQVILDVYKTIYQAESIVKSPIQNPDNDDAWITPEFNESYQSVKDIGLEMTNKTFIESKSRGYKAKIEKASISHHGYMKSDLPDLVAMGKQIAEIATAKWVKQTSTQFKEIESELLAYEKKVLENKALDEESKQKTIKETKIRTSRLFWLSNFIHLLNMLANDCIECILIVLRVADKAIPLAINPERNESDPRKHYF